MNDDDSRWWLLQVQFQERHPAQLNLLSQPLSRDELLRKCFNLIPKSIRANRGLKIWGLADLNNINENIIIADLTVRPPNAQIAQEPEPGVLEETHEPRYFAPIIVHIPSQIIAVNRAPDISRFARSAMAFAIVFYDLLNEAMQKIAMTDHYILEVEAIAKTGSFVQWYNGLEKLNRISIHYVGPNLPSPPTTLENSIRNTAREFKNILRSENVDLVANEPHLEEDQVRELDHAVAERRLKMRANGVRNGMKTSWSSSVRPEPETIKIPMTEEELYNQKIITKKMVEFLEKRFVEDKI